MCKVTGKLTLGGKVKQEKNFREQGDSEMVPQIQEMEVIRTKATSICILKMIPKINK
jgi:hypothetical protein